MPLSTEHAVRETYRLALEERLRNAVKTKEEFERYRDIQKEAAERIDHEKDAFRANYHQRLEKAREVILREHHSKVLDHPKPDWAVDTPPSADKVDLLARNRVQADHEKRILAIRIDQSDKYQELHKACRRREQEPSRERQAFNLTQELSPQEKQSRGLAGPSQT